MCALQTVGAEAAHIMRTLLNQILLEERTRGTFIVVEFPKTPQSARRYVMYHPRFCTEYWFQPAADDLKWIEELRFVNGMGIMARLPASSQWAHGTVRACGVNRGEIQSIYQDLIAPFQARGNRNNRYFRVKGSQDVVIGQPTK